MRFERVGNHANARLPRGMHGRSIAQEESSRLILRGSTTERSFIMSHKGLIGLHASGTLVRWSLVVVAQQQSNPSQEKSGPTGRGMMSGGMMMNQMMAQHQEMSQLMSKMVQSMRASNSE